MSLDVFRYTRGWQAHQKAKPRGGKPPGLVPPMNSHYQCKVVVYNIKAAGRNVDPAKIEQAAYDKKSHRHLEFNARDGVLRRTRPLSSAACGFATSLAPK